MTVSEQGSVFGSYRLKYMNNLLHLALVKAQFELNNEELGPNLRRIVYLDLHIPSEKKRKLVEN